jgi:hypothetical protein
VTLAAALLGGTLTATTHFSKASTRAMVNASPEPFSNVALSFAEDGLVTGGSWLAVSQPLAFLVLLALFVVAAVVMLRWIVRGARRLMSRPEDVAHGGSG